eukprot:gene24486-20901_t
MGSSSEAGDGGAAETTLFIITVTSVVLFCGYLFQCRWQQLFRQKQVATNREKVLYRAAMHENISQQYCRWHDDSCSSNIRVEQDASPVPA